MVTATRYGRFCSVIEIHSCVGRSGCGNGRNGAVTAVTAWYAPLRNSFKLFLSKKHKKKIENGRRGIERRGKIKRENRGARDREEGRWRTCYWFVKTVRPILFYSVAITQPFCLCVSIYILFENNNNNKCGHYLFGFVKICIYIYRLLFILLLLSLFILYLIGSDWFFV